MLASICEKQATQAAGAACGELLDAGKRHRASGLWHDRGRPRLAAAPGARHAAGCSHTPRSVQSAGCPHSLRELGLAAGPQGAPMMKA